MLTVTDETRLRQALRAAGAQDAHAAYAHLQNLTKLGVLPLDVTDFMVSLGEVASVEAALLSLLRLSESQPQTAMQVLNDSLLSRFFLRVCGASDMLGDYLLSHPQLLDVQWLTEFSQYAPAELGEWITVLAQKQGGDLTQVAGLRAAYWQTLLGIAYLDLAGVDVVEVSAYLSQLVDVTLENALTGALGKNQSGIRFTVIAMGKTGAQELNYISDVDLLYIYQPGPTQTAEAALAEATQVAAQLGMIVSGPGSHPPLWPIDLGLRPEGKDGAVARTLESYRAYYQKWAQNWEFQALLKARFAAGDAALGQEFLEMVRPLVWTVAGKPDFVSDVRQMRKTVEANIPRKDMERQLKLGRGGLRDIEFSVQLLQLVHGRTDESLRVRGTIEAIAALAEGGYIGRDAGKELTGCYRFLRLLEHRSQLLKMRRTHLVPTQPAVLTRLARGMRTHYADLRDRGDLESYWQNVKRRVRELHRAIFYRPLVETIATVGSELAGMSEASAADRLQAFGYADPQGALRHVRALTVGTSRTASIQRQLMPAILAWLADGADPDQGILNFRKLSEEIGTSHWYLGLLRDSSVAAQRLCRILPTSTYATHALMKLPEAVKWLDDDRLLEPLADNQVWGQAQAILERYEYTPEAVLRLRAFRDQELTRAALADLVLGISQGRCAQTITAVTDVTVAGALEVARRFLGFNTTFVTAVAMGRYGGGELTYGSDADVIFIHVGDLAEAEKIVKHAVSLLNSVAEYNAVNLDMDLRPEGKNGSLSRNTDSYLEYWEKWALAWEKHALVRARVLGSFHPESVELGTVFAKRILEYVYGSGLDSEELKTIRLLKARMETERIPRGVAPTQHLKLGPGGLTDVEWLVQVKQLELGYAHASLQTTNTLKALAELEKLGVVSAADAVVLREAWLGASHLRAANVLATDKVRGRDVLPRQLGVSRMVSLILGDLPEQWQQVHDHLLKSARQARKVFEKIFYESVDNS